MSYSAAFSAFKKCVRKAGIKKRVWLHLLKHVSCTEDYRRGMPDSYRKFKHHWSPNSKMTAVYEHLSQTDILTIQKDTWKRFMGVDFGNQQTVQSTMQLTKKCKRCNFENSQASNFCDRCGFCLDEKKSAEAAVIKTKVDALLDALTENPETLDKLLALVKS